MLDICNDGFLRAIDVLIVGMRASVCGYGKDSAFALRDSGASVFTGEGDEDCASALRCSGSLCCLLNVTPPAPCRRALPLRTRDTLTTRSTLLLGGLGHQASSFRLSRLPALGDLLHHASRIADEAFEGFFRTFPRFQKSAEFDRQCGNDPPGGNFHAERSSNGSCRSRRAHQLMDAGGL